MPESGEVTRLLIEWSSGKAEALENLLPLVYDELRRIAGGYLRRERPGHVLQPTALVHEVFLKLVDQQAIEWKSRAHFFGIMARSMRQILVDHARARTADRRGGDAIRIPLDEGLMGTPPRAVDLINLDDVLNRLASLDPDLARMVELRFFGGLTVEEAAVVLEISPRTVKREWRTARAWLQKELAGISE